MHLLEKLNWRYATKKFDANKEITEDDFKTLKEAVRLSVSSYGLQLYKVLIIENKELRTKLQPVSWGQTQIVDASKLFVFCNYATLKPEDVQEYINLKAKSINVDPKELQGYADFINSKLSERSGSEIEAWTAKQTYLALGNLLDASAELKIDACPMEGFEPDKYDEILGLKEKGLNAAVVAAVGYRSDEDQTQNSPKVRKPDEDLFIVM